MVQLLVGHYLVIIRLLAASYYAIDYLHKDKILEKRLQNHMINVSLRRIYHFLMIFSGMNIAFLKNWFTFEAYLLSNKDCVGLSALALDKNKTT